MTSERISVSKASCVNERRTLHYLAQCSETGSDGCCDVSRQGDASVDIDPEVADSTLRQLWLLNAYDNNNNIRLLGFFRF